MPRPKQNKVKLSAEERDFLKRLIGQGEAKARVLTRARILLSWAERHLPGLPAVDRRAA